MPNIGFVEICGHPLTSVFSIADHCFISSEIGGIFGRSRITRDCGFAGGFRFAFFALIGEFLLNVAAGFSPASFHQEAVRKSSEAPRFNNDSAWVTIPSMMLAALGRSCSKPAASPTTVRYISKSCCLRASA